MSDHEPAGAPCWIELFAADPETSLTFYRELFGWTWESAGPEYGGYINVAKDGRKVAGCMRNDGSQGAPDGWSVYLRTDDVAKVAEAARAHGGAVIMPPMQVMALGSMAIVSDAGQAIVGAWQPGEHRGFEAHGSAGTPCWFELFTREFSATVDFYREVFGWDAHAVSDTPEFRYTTLGTGDDQRAGIMDASGFLPAGVPAHWSIYFGTDDADATIAKGTALGGTVIQPAEDTPYGRLAVVADPTGVQFKLVQG